MPQKAGWYHADGDPSGTFRYWDSQQWVGGAKSAEAIDLAETPTGSGPVPNVVTFGDAWERLLARFFDGVFLIIAGVMLRQLSADVSSGKLTVVMTLVVLVYEIAFVAVIGATPGKKMFGLTVINGDNVAPPGWGPSVMRALPLLIGLIPVAGWVVSLAVSIASGVLISTLLDPRSVFDLVGRTHVVKNVSLTPVS